MDVSVCVCMYMCMLALYPFCVCMFVDMSIFYMYVCWYVCLFICLFQDTCLYTYKSTIVYVSVSTDRFLWLIRPFLRIHTRRLAGVHGSAGAYRCISVHICVQACVTTDFCGPSDTVLFACLYECHKNYFWLMHQHTTNVPDWVSAIIAILVTSGYDAQISIPWLWPVTVTMRKREFDGNVWPDFGHNSLSHILSYRDRDRDRDRVHDRDRDCESTCSRTVLRCAHQTIRQRATMTESVAVAVTRSSRWVSDFGVRMKISIHLDRKQI
jgi:hypothetical protein